jgi:predicted nucleic acid-binding protein
LTAVADSRLLLTLEFPPNPEAKVKIRDLFEKELRGRMIAPSIVLTEFIKHAGVKIGEESTKTRIRLLKEMGLQIVSLDEECALTAGSLLLSKQNTPIADALIASLVKNGVADYVITDDTHFKALGIKTKWI